MQLLITPFGESKNLFSVQHCANIASNVVLYGTSVIGTATVAAAIFNHSFALVAGSAKVSTGVIAIAGGAAAFFLAASLVATATFLLALKISQG